MSADLRLPRSFLLFEKVEKGEKIHDWIPVIDFFSFLHLFKQNKFQQAVGPGVL